MSGIRVLIGTKKGAFVLTSDAKRKDWKVDGPHFAGWEIYHMKGSPADPDRIYASQTSGWFGQIIQRSSAGTQGIAAASQADRLYAASLVTASATARALAAEGSGRIALVAMGNNGTAAAVTGTASSANRSVNPADIYVDKLFRPATTAQPASAPSSSPAAASSPMNRTPSSSFARLTTSRTCRRTLQRVVHGLMCTKST